MKKALIIITIILFLLLLVGTIWFFFFEETDSNRSATETEERVFFPTSSPESETPTEEATSTPEAPIPTETVSTVEIPVLRQISDKPTSGFVTFFRDREIVTDASTTTPETIEDKEEIVYRYVERSTGHVYEATDSTLTIERLSNTTIPRIQEALISPDGLTYILRYFNSQNGIVETFVSELKENDINSTSTVATGDESKFMLDGEFFPTDIDEVVYGPGQEFAYILINILDSGVYYDTSLQTSKSKAFGPTVFSSPLSEWIPQWPGTNLITMTSKADSRLNGVSYFINPANNSSRVILSDIKGLTTNTSPDGSYVLYSQSRTNEVNTFILDTESGETGRLSMNTLPEKCVWSERNKTTLYCAVPSQLPRVNYPEDWYKGVVLFSDNIWEIDVDIHSYHQILKGSDFSETPFDVIKPDIDPNEDYLTFINKRDLTLWTLRLN